MALFGNIGPRVVKNPLSNAGIGKILKQVHPDMNIGSEAVHLVQTFVSPIENGLKLLFTPEDIDRYIIENLTGELANHARTEFRKHGLKSSIVEYLAAEILELAGNSARDRRRTTIGPYDIIIAIGLDNELLKVFKNDIPLYVHLHPMIEKGNGRLVIGKMNIKLKGRKLSDDYKRGLHNLLIAIVNYYAPRPRNESFRVAQAVAQRSGRIGESMPRNPIYHLEDQVLRTVLAYSMVLQPTGILTYMTLLKATMTNPYLADVPIVQMVQENSTIVKILAEREREETSPPTVEEIPSPVTAPLIPVTAPSIPSPDEIKEIQEKVIHQIEDKYKKPFIPLAHDPQTNFYVRIGNLWYPKRIDFDYVDRIDYKIDRLRPANYKEQFIHLMGPTDIIAPQSLILEFSYQLAQRHQFQVEGNDPQGMSRLELANYVGLLYNQIYDEDEKARQENKELPYGTHNRGIDDLVVFNVDFIELGTRGIPTYFLSVALIQ